MNDHPRGTSDIPKAAAPTYRDTSSTLVQDFSGTLLNFIRARNSYRVDVDHLVPELVAHLDAAIDASRDGRRPEDGMYAGEANESGFVIRRIAAHGKDTRAAVVARGRFEPQGESTVVCVTIRHGRHMVFLSWLLVLVACCGAGVAAGPSASSARAGLAVIGGMAVLWHCRLYLNVRRVSREVRALLLS